MKEIKPLKNKKLQSVTDDDVKTAFVKYAKDKERSESQALEILVKRELKATGYLK